MEQQALQQQQEAERQRRIVENNAEIERLTNMLREHCRAIGIDYDYMLNFYENCYKEKDATEDIINIDNEINKYQDFNEAIKLKEVMKPLKRKQLIQSLLITPALCFILVVPIMLFAFQKYILASIVMILSIIFFAKPMKSYFQVSKKINTMIMKNNEVRLKYRTSKYGTISENEGQIKILNEKKSLLLAELNKDVKKYQKEFDEFRKNHYNKELELLFKDLQINFNRIEKKDIKANGTIEDYKEYFEDKILEN